MILWFLIIPMSGCLALDNGLALRPPMGWMQWQRYRCLVDCKLYPNECIREELFKRIADLMVSGGYKDAGYEYVMIDDCWMSFQRDPSTRRLQPNATRFPSGMKDLGDYIHGKGLKFGIYADFGSETCMGYPGSLGYLDIDAHTFAEWGVDYLKLDGCYVKTELMQTGYANMSKYLNETGRPIVYSCSWPAYMEPSKIRPDYSALTKFCNLWRNWYDISDSWSSVKDIMEWFSENQNRIAPFAGPGHWNDPDMLLTGNFGLSYDQSKTQLAVWAILAAPFIMSVDLTKIKPEFSKLLLNEELIKINQDELGKQGKLIIQKYNIAIWKRTLEPEVDGHHSYALAFVSLRSDGYPYRLAIQLHALGLNNERGYRLKDVFEPIKLPITKPHEEVVVRVNPSGTVFLKATPITEK